MCALQARVISFFVAGCEDRIELTKLDANADAGAINPKDWDAGYGRR
jgi:hypothetical protein